ncbi:MAG: SNF2 family DNA-dependent ATPase [Trebouxia sp. A1-2]|nr:MAG: SNF2 family DNA-dependent ATPase [Trebouxia sp. A1-2]
MDADLSDEEFLLADTQLNFALRMPSLAQDVAGATLDSDGQHSGTCKHARQAVVTCVIQDHKYIYDFADTVKDTICTKLEVLVSLRDRIWLKVILISPPSSDKPARPKRRHGNAQIFYDSEGEDEDESGLHKPVAKRLRQVPAEIQEVKEWQEIPEPDIVLWRRRMHVQADATTTGREDDMIQQLREAGEELQDNEIDAVLERCEQLSLKLRQALQTYGTDRFAAPDTAPTALVSHATLVAACGEAAKYFKPYQMVGVNFLMLLKRQSISGSILADEMGLGKTAQAICFLGVLKHVDKDSGPHLVVAPASLLENWQRELQRWCPGLRLVTYYGKDRAQLRRQLMHARQELPFDVMLTCYSLFERDSVEQQADRSFLKKWQWSHLVLDEAHAVKNANAMRTKRLTSVAQHCKRRIMLTGTPLQNDLEELQNLLQFLLPDVFSKEEFSQLEDLQQEEAVQRLTERMKAVLGPFVLRRLKSEVASQLTAKQQHERVVEMTRQQTKMYHKAVQHLRAKIGANDKEGQAVVKQLGKQQVDSLFTHLRKIAQHPLLVRNLFSDAQVQRLVSLAHQRQVLQLFGGGCSQARISEELMTYSDHRLHTFALLNGLNSFVLEDAAAKGSRALIFSQWTSVLDILGWLLEMMGLTYVRLDGSTAVADRLSTVDMFNNPAKGIFAFLLSTRAGGQGLNLTVDEGIHALAKQKLKLDAAVLEGITAGSLNTQNIAATDAVQMRQLLQSLVAETGTDKPLQENEKQNTVIAID